MLSINLTAATIELGAVALVPRGSPVASLLRALGPPTRCLAISTTNALYLYDQLGLRFWAAPATGLVGELQLVLETQPRAVFPTQPFTGLLRYEGQPERSGGPAGGHLCPSGHKCPGLGYLRLLICARYPACLLNESYPC